MKHFQRELDKIKKMILSLGALVEKRVHQIKQVLEERDVPTAREIIHLDHEIDEMEVDVEEECLKIIALHQPVATDLRFLIAVVKINNDLERIGDLAANIAKRARRICKEPEAGVPNELGEAALKARDMVRNSLTAFVNLDAQMANDVRDADDEVDELCKDVFKFVTQAGKKDPERLSIYLTMLLAARNLERIGDHATNIAEDIIYLIDGVIVRHPALDETE